MKIFALLICLLFIAQIARSQAFVSTYTFNNEKIRVNSVFADVNNQMVGINSTLTSQINNGNAAVKTLEQKLQQTEESLNNAINQGINNLPQRLLSEEAKVALKEAVLADLRIELAALRKDMQQQIDELKSKKQF